MAKNESTSAIVDGVLRFTVVGGSIAAGLFLPNLLVTLDKPLNKYFAHLDKNAREREVRRVLSYMKSHKLLTENYEHGIVLTETGKKRLEQAEFESLKIKPLKEWDYKWRIVLYDIPENKKVDRRILQLKLQKLGFRQLQRSVLIHPFPCREVIESVSNHYKLSVYVSYIEATGIDNQAALISKFQKSLPNTSFK